MVTDEFLKHFADIAGKAAGPPVVHDSAEPAHVYLLRDCDGNYQRVEATAPPQTHTPADLDTLAELAAEVVGTVPPDLWYSRAAVVLVLPGRDRATLPLTLSPQLQRLAEWEKGVTLNQAAIIRALTVIFPDNVQGVEVRELVRKVQVNVQTTAEQGPNRRSIGKEAEAKLGEGNTLPSVLTFTVPVFAQGSLSGVRAQVPCAFDLDPSSGTAAFTITPHAGAVEAAVTDGERQIGSRLRGLMNARKVEPDAYGLYYGKP